MYTTTTVDIPAGRQYRLLENGSPMPFRRFFELLGTGDDFADWYTAQLAAFDAEAVYWELPPLTAGTIDRDTEFVLIEAPMLARFPPEPAPFSSYFDRAPDEDVIVFPNLAGDAVMVVPCPRGPDEHYPHLAEFLRNAPKEQVRAVWHRTAQEMLRNIGERPVWLSTAGGGVAWLHLRLDSRPKYYSYRPYRDPQLQERFSKRDRFSRAQARCYGQIVRLQERFFNRDRFSRAQARSCGQIVRLQERFWNRDPRMRESAD